MGNNHSESDSDDKDNVDHDDIDEMLGRLEPRRPLVNRLQKLQNSGTIRREHSKNNVTLQNEKLLDILSSSPVDLEAVKAFFNENASIDINADCKYINTSY